LVVFIVFSIFSQYKSKVLRHFDKELIELINLNSELSQSPRLLEVTAYCRRHKIWLHDHPSQPVIGVVSESEISNRRLR